MWKCKHCDTKFDFVVKTEKANHSRWCKSNPANHRALVKTYLRNKEPFSDSHRAKLSAITKAHIEAHGSNWQGLKHTQETKAKIAKALRGNTNGNRRRDRQSQYNGIRMDSGWEVKAAEYLDKQGIEWSYGKIVFPLDEKRSYRPDFVLADGLVIEVKGYWRPENKRKFEEWQQKYPGVKFEVWDGPKLRSLGIVL